MFGDEDRAEERAARYHEREATRRAVEGVAVAMPALALHAAFGGITAAEMERIVKTSRKIGRLYAAVASIVDDMAADGAQCGQPFEDSKCHLPSGHTCPHETTVTWSTERSTS